MREPEQNSAGKVPKLLTEAEWRALKHERLMDRFLTELRARNLIAPEPEPIDPIEAAYREGYRQGANDAPLHLIEDDAWRCSAARARGVTMEKNNG